MTDATQKLLDELDAYCREWRTTGKRLAPSTVTSRAVKDSRVPERLRCGHDITTRRMAKIRKYMADNPPPVAEACEEQERSAA